MADKISTELKVCGSWSLGTTTNSNFVGCRCFRLDISRYYGNSVTAVVYCKDIARVSVWRCDGMRSEEELRVEGMVNVNDLLN